MLHDRIHWHLVGIYKRAVDRFGMYNPLKRVLPPFFYIRNFAMSGEGLNPDTVGHSILGDALELPTSKLVAKTRFLKAAMTERLASWDQHNFEGRGLPDERLVQLYDVWGKGGFGIILSTSPVLVTRFCALTGLL